KLFLILEPRSIKSSFYQVFGVGAGVVAAFAGKSTYRVTERVVCKLGYPPAPGPTRQSVIETSRCERCTPARNARSELKPPSNMMVLLMAITSEGSAPSGGGGAFVLGGGGASVGADSAVTSWILLPVRLHKISRPRRKSLCSC